jgi:hypothetical protein
MRKATVDAADLHPAPLLGVSGPEGLDTTIATLQKRITILQAQSDLANSTDFPARS